MPMHRSLLSWEIISGKVDLRKLRLSLHLFEMAEKLDNPVWYSLSETHKKFAIVYEHLKFYTPDHCRFGAFDVGGDMLAEIDEYIKLTDNFFIVGKKPSFSNKIILKNELVCFQMVIDNKIDVNSNATIIRLNDEFNDQLFDLVNLVQPG